MEKISPLFNGNNLEEWQRLLTKDETVLKLKLSIVGNHKVFCFEMANLRNWPPLAMKFLLLDMVGPRGPGSDIQSRQSSGKGVAFFLIISLEDCAWKAVPLFLALMMPPADLLSSIIISRNDFSIETPQASLSTPQANPAPITEMKRKTGNKNVCVAGGSGAGGGGDKSGQNVGKVSQSGGVGGLSGGSGGQSGGGGNPGGGSGGKEPSGGRGTGWKCEKCGLWNFARRRFCYRCKIFRVAGTTRPRAQNCDPDADMEPEKLKFPIIFDLESFAILREILVGLGLEEYADAFARNHIDLDLFMEMSVGDLISIGITSFGAQRILADAIEELRREN